MRLHVVVPEYRILNEAKCSLAVLAFYKMLKQTAKVLDKLKAAIVTAINSLERPQRQ